MKHRFALFVLVVLATCTARPLAAAGGPPPWAGQGGAGAGAGGGPARASIAPSEAGEQAELAALERFLSMSDEELDQLQRAIARVRAMSPAERSALREKMLEFRRLPAAHREQVRLGWGWVSDEDRRDWPEWMRSRSDEERAAIQAELQQLPVEERAARKHVLLEAWRAQKP